MTRPGHRTLDPPQDTWPEAADAAPISQRTHRKGLEPTYALRVEVLLSFSKAGVGLGRKKEGFFDSVNVISHVLVDPADVQNPRSERRIRWGYPQDMYIALFL